MEQTHSLSQPTSSVSILNIFGLLSLTHSGQAQPSAYLNDSTHNLNSSPPGSSQSEELFKRSVMLVIWYKVGPYRPILITFITFH